MVAPELEKEGVADVAMALLFLSYGRAPFAITKLEYTSNESPKKRRSCVGISARGILQISRVG